MKGKQISILSLVISLVVGLLFFNAGCKKSESSAPDPVGAFGGYTGCIQGDSSQRAGVLTDTPVQECVVLHYDGNGNLDIDHMNALFNCCPGEIHGEVQINGHTIVIREDETQAGCHCNCHYNLEFQVTNLQAGNYTIQVACFDGRVLEFSFILSSDTSSTSHCWDSPLSVYN